MYELRNQERLVTNGAPRVEQRATESQSLIDVAFLSSAHRIEPKQPGDLMGVVPVGQQGTDGVARPDHNVTSPGHVCYLASGWRCCRRLAQNGIEPLVLPFVEPLKWGQTIKVLFQERVRHSRASRKPAGRNQLLRRQNLEGGVLRVGDIS